MRAHILAIAVVSGVIIVSLAAGHALTEHLLAMTGEQSEPAAAMPAP
jgi:hypothetical protein